MDQKPEHNVSDKSKGTPQPPRLAGTQSRFPRPPRLEGAQPRLPRSPGLVGAQLRIPRPPMAPNPLALSWPRQPTQVPQANNQIRGPGPVKNDLSKSQAVEEITRGMSNLSGEDALVPINRCQVRGRLNLDNEVDYYRIPRPESSNSGKQGNSGQPINLVANYFPITSYTNWSLYQYRVDFRPEEDRIAVKKGLLAIHRKILGSYIFDGSMLFSSIKYDSEEFTLASKRESDDKIVIIAIFFTSVLEKNDFTYIQVFNLMMRKCLQNLNLVQIGRYYYDELAKINIAKHKLQLLPGYETAIGMYDNGLLLRTEIRTKIMRDETIHDFFLDCIKNHKTNFMDVFKTGIIGTIVLTRYNNQTYRIDDIDDGMTPIHKFKMKGGRQISFVDYYKKNWNINIKVKNQPMLMSKKKKSMITNYDDVEVIYLVPELCSLTGLSESMRSNFHLMKEVSQYTNVNPLERIKRYNNFMNRLQSTPDSITTLKNWNLNLSKELVRFEGRVLSQQKIYSKTKSYEGGSEADWTRQVRSLPMYVSVVLQRWAILYPRQNEREVREFINTIRKVAKTMSFNIPPPEFFPVNTEHIRNYSAALESITNVFNPAFIFCVTLSQRSDVYNLIKRHLCISRAVPSQVALLKTVSNNNTSVAVKIAIQINCKLGGAPWMIRIPTPGIMIAGFDVCHDTQNKKKSFGALIASINDDHTRYFSSVLPHPNGEELANNFCIQIAGALNAYRKLNGRLPAMIIIYRDGVGDGQVSYVHKTEVKLVKEACKSFYNSQPPMAFIIVKKRINTRFFAAPQGSPVSNPPPGTVVDSVLTDPTMYDFYITPQQVKHGTVNPTHYNIIVDTLPNWSPNKMHLLTFKLCHLYYNWSATVRVPAHCQMAHKLAFLTSQSLQGKPNTALNELLYFL